MTTFGGRRVDLLHGCYQIVESGAVVTHFGDGSSLEAQPMLDDESVARARALGYVGRDFDVVWLMTLDHDRIHMELAQAEGLPWSPTLWAVANGVEPDAKQGHAEECRVFYVQRAINVWKRS